MIRLLRRVIEPLGVLFFHFLIHSQLIRVAFAQTTHTVDWTIPFGGGPLPSKTATVGDTAVFEWSFFHNVYIHPSGTCSTSGRVSVGSSSGASYTFKSSDVGEVVFACDVGSHCEFGQIITFTVSPLPTDSPTFDPTSDPTVSPTNDPTASPTMSPTSTPTNSPTDSPTNTPTSTPTSTPTDSPTAKSSAVPSAGPTKSPTETPTATHTNSPSSSTLPTAPPGPTTSPSMSHGPTVTLSSAPTMSSSPTTAPTTSTSPSSSPTVSVSPTASVSPTTSPSASTAPTTDTPTVSPSSALSGSPSAAFSSRTTEDPTPPPSLLVTDPTLYPTMRPTHRPTPRPTVGDGDVTSPPSLLVTDPTLRPTARPTVTAATAAPVNAYGLPACTSDRPGWATYRRVFVPRTMMTGVDTAAEAAWSEALCCVYTRVEVIDSTAPRGRLVLYDGSSYRVLADSFEELADTFLTDICEMPMGAEDCRLRARCLATALAKLS